jgi:hypothetical protein
MTLKGALKLYFDNIEKGITSEEQNINSQLKGYKEQLKQLEEFATRSLTKTCPFDSDSFEARHDMIESYVISLTDKKKKILHVDPSSLAERIIEELENLRKHKFIEKITTHEKLLEIETKELLYHDRFKIGKFIIIIDFTFRPTDILRHIRVMNINRTSSLYQHWCIKDERVCWGEWESGLRNLFEKGYLYLVIDNILRFLHTDSSHGYIYLVNWFDDTEGRSLTEKELRQLQRFRDLDGNVIRELRQDEIQEDNYDSMIGTTTISTDPSEPAYRINPDPLSTGY